MNDKASDICKNLSRYIKDYNTDIKIKEYDNPHLNTCTLDIIDKNISEQSKKYGLGEFEAFMSITYSKRHEELTTEIPIITAVDYRKGDDGFIIPSTCRIDAIHNHNGKIPVIHAHIHCGKGYDLQRVAQFIDTITKINQKNLS